MSNDEALLAASRAAFMEEARDMLQQFEQALLALESNPQDDETLNAAFRAAHTIKGSSGLFGFQSVVHFTHEVEAVMDAMRVGGLEVNEVTIALLLRARDQIEAMLVDLAAGAADARAADDTLTAELRALRDGCAAPATRAVQAETRPVQAPAVAPAGTWRVNVRFKQDALRNGFDPLSFIRYLPRVATVEKLRTVLDAVPALEAIDAEACYLAFELELSGVADRNTIVGVFEFAADDCELDIVAPALPAHAPVAAAVPAAAAPAPAGAPAGADRRTGDRRAEDRRTEDRRFIRVSADKLDRLIDMIGELVIAGSGAQLIARQAGSNQFIEAAQRIAHLIEETRDGALQLRMVQIGETFARFQRVVRDTARSLGKQIELVITGGETELDKSMVEMIADPLMHLVRNSLDHGIEAPDVRAAAGKPARGQLALNAYHDSGSVVIEVRDDGGGLNRRRILAKAIERGLVADPDALTEDEVNHLIFAPGFSTAAAVTNISGRGVGMDVVKRNIEALRGTVQLTTTEGRGTTVQIRLPLTLAIIDGFLVGIDTSHYIVPLESVVECIERPARSDGDSGFAGYFDLRGEVLPFLDLRRFFALADPQGDTRQSMVVVRYGPAKIGLLVDKLHGEYQTVIKPLSKLFSSLRGIAGSTILGSGQVALILDVAALVANATRRASSSTAGRAQAVPASA